MKYNDCNSIASIEMSQPTLKTSTITDNIKQLAGIVSDISRSTNEINYRLYGSFNNNVCEDSGPIEDTIESILKRLIDDTEVINKKLYSIVERL